VEAGTHAFSDAVAEGFGARGALGAAEFG
jgi:hypothetical protein